MKVAIAEFKSHLSKYIRQVQAGDVVELTAHRRVVATVQGVVRPDCAAQHGDVSRLVAAGMATWGGGKPIGASLRLNAAGASVSALVLEGRN